MPTKSDQPGTGYFIKSEANGDRSRDQITVASGQGALIPGTVLGKITASGKFGLYDNDAVDGRQTVAGLLYAAVDATSADAVGVAIARDAEVYLDRLTWGAAVTTQAEKDAAVVEMTAAGLITR